MCIQSLLNTIFSRSACIILLITVSNLQAPLSAEVTTTETQVSQDQNLIYKEHIFEAGSKKFEYESCTGSLSIKNSEDKAKANIFFTAYFRKDISPDEQLLRPLTFCFNGGPGSSSIWLHMGLLGPKRVDIKDLGTNVPPSGYKTNPFTLLDVSDLVFVDPVSTGFSRAADGIDAKNFNGYEEDISSIAEFIRLFVTHFDRWGSSKYLIGESYGTLRVVGLAERLHSEYYLDINGLVLISSCLELQGLDFDSSNDLAFVLALPSYTATAWYHKKLAPELHEKSLPELLAEVEEFALHEYATALLIGDRLESQEKEHIATLLASYSGLSLEYVKRSNLRIPTTRFFKELLRDKRKLIGRFDSRYDLSVRDAADDEATMEFDPSFVAITGAFTSSFQQYLYQNLGCKKDEQYKVLVNLFPWNFGFRNQPPGTGYLGVSDHLSSIMTKNPSLHVFCASGYYDLATPYFAQDYTLDHLFIDPKLRAKIEQHYYEAGHMMYLSEPVLKKMNEELKEFIVNSKKK